MLEVLSNKIIGFDTETEHWIINGEEHNWLMSIQLYDGKQKVVIKSEFPDLYKYFDRKLFTPEELVKKNRARMSRRFITELEKMFANSKNKMLFALNLTFDASQIDLLANNEIGKSQLDQEELGPLELLHKSNIISANGRAIGGETYLVDNGTHKVSKVLIRDVGRFYMGGLDSIATKLLGKHKYKDPDLLKGKPFTTVEDFNEWWDVTLFGNHEYATRDAVITQEAGVVIFNTYGTPLTISSASMKEFEGIYEGLRDKKGSAIDLFWKSNYEPEIYAVAKDAAAGGLTLSPINEYKSFKGMKRTILFKCVLKLDITSAYPNAMSKLRYVSPVVKGTLIATTEQQLRNIMDDDQYMLVKFFDLTFKYPEGKMTDAVKTSRYSSAKPFFEVIKPRDTSFANITFRRFMRDTESMNFRLAIVYYFDYDDVATKALHQYIAKNFRLKTQGKKEHNKVMEMEGKSKLNNLSGKLNQHIIIDEYLIDNELIRTEHDFNKDYHWFNPLMYAEITGYVRGQMTDAINKLGLNKTIQVDTDSLKIQVSNEQEIESYKDELKYLNDEYADPETGLGYVKQEGYFKSYMILQRKVHGGMSITDVGSPKSMADFNVPNKDTEHHWAHAGMRNEAFDEIVGSVDDPGKVYNAMLKEPDYVAMFARRTPEGIVIKSGMKTVKSLADVSDIIEYAKTHKDFTTVYSRLDRVYDESIYGIMDIDKEPI